MYVVSFARSVVLYEPQVDPSVAFCHVPSVGVAVLSVSSNDPVTASYKRMVSVGTVPPNAVECLQANRLLVASLFVAENW